MDNKEIKSDDILLTDIEIIDNSPEFTDEDEEIPGDENYPHFFMPDGTYNEKLTMKIDKWEEEYLKAISFKNAPPSLKKDIIVKTLFGLFSLVGGIVLYAFNMSAPYLLALTTLLGCLLLFSAGKRYFAIKNRDIIEFAGIIVDVQNFGLIKATKYSVVKISDNNKFLNVKLNSDKHLTKGLPITLYISKEEPIVSSEYGPLVNHILGLTFDVKTSQDDEYIEEEMSAKDYLSN